MREKLNSRTGDRSRAGFLYLLFTCLLLSCSAAAGGCGPFGIIPLAGIAAGAGGGGDDHEEPPFVVVSIEPLDGENGVDLYAPITVIFSHCVDQSTIHSTNFAVGSPFGPVSGNFYFYDHSTKVIFVPSGAYPGNEDITVRINNVSQGGMPGKVINNFVSSFRTAGSSTSSPYIVSVVPQDSSTVPFQTYLQARVLFSKPMNTATITSASFYIYHVGSGVSLNGSVSWDADFREFVFDPTDALVAGDHYEVHVLGSVQSTDGYNLDGGDFTSSFHTIDITPTYVMIPAGVSNPADWINIATESSVTVKVGLNSNVEFGNSVVVVLSDGSNYTYGDRQVSSIPAPSEITITGIDASLLNDGPITLEAMIWRGDSCSEITTGSADKDTAEPAISIAAPPQLPQYYELRTLEMSITVDSDCNLYLEGGSSSQSYNGLSSGTYRIDYDLKVADSNDIDIYARDDAGNESTYIQKSIIHRGGAGGGPASGALQVSVYLESDLTPVSGAMVVRGYNTEAVSSTDPQGEVTFNGVSGPQTVTVICPGYPMFTICDVDAARLSIPLSDKKSPQFGTVSGSVSPVPTSGFLHGSELVDWAGTDINITDGDYTVRVQPNKFYTLSAIDNTGGAFSNFAVRDNLGPLTGGLSYTEDIGFPLTPPTAIRVDSGDVTLPGGFYPPDGLIWRGGEGCLIMGRTRAEVDRFMCGYGVFPLTAIYGGPFPYSSIQPGYFAVTSDEYWVLLHLRDMYGRKIIGMKKFDYNTDLPDFVFPDTPVLDKPGTGGVVTSLIPTFEWSDSNTFGIHTLEIVNTKTNEEWIIVRQGGIHTATLPRIPNTAPFKVLEYTDDPTADPAIKLVWRIESNHTPGPLNYDDFALSELELGTQYMLESEWREFWLWSPQDTQGRVPVFGAAGKQSGTLTVTVVDFGTQVGVQGVVVFLGDDPTGYLLTDADGQVVFNNPPVPAKVTICYTGYPYMTIDQVQSAYATIPLIDPNDMDGNNFTLYGEVMNLPTGNSGWVEVSDYRGQWFNIEDDFASGLSDDQTVPNTPFDGPSLENYSLIASDREDYAAVTGFYGPQSGNHLFEYAYFSGHFQVNPAGSPPFLQAPIIDFSTSSTTPLSPIRHSTDPSDIRLPSNLTAGATVDWVNAEPYGFSTDNSWSEQVLVKLGQGSTAIDAIDPTLYHYGITFANPPNFTIDALGLWLRADGQNPDGTEWESAISLRDLTSYPRRYDATLPDIPYPINPVHMQTNVGLPTNMIWTNSEQGKSGVYMIGLTRGFAHPRPFFWMIIKPIPQTGLSASITVPVLPAVFNQPEIGETQQFQIEGNIVPGFGMSSWSGEVLMDRDKGYVQWDEGYFTP